MLQTKTKRGFTIIEVVLVLAIAGLIFMMVFIALPALQRSQRDTQRREDLSRFMSQIQQYESNNRQKVPSDQSSLTKFVQDYLNTNGDTFNDPDGNPYAAVFVGASAVQASGSQALDFNSTTNTQVVSGSGSVNAHIIYYYQNATCSGENAVKSTGNNKVAIRYKLENAGTYCQSI